MIFAHTNKFARIMPGTSLPEKKPAVKKPVKKTDEKENK